MECASCHQSPGQNPNVALQRVNAKGVSGVFICQFCWPAPSSARPGGGRAARCTCKNKTEPWGAADLCAIHDGEQYPPPDDDPNPVHVAARALPTELVVAVVDTWNEFDGLLIEQAGTYDAGTQRFAFKDSPEAWDAYHRLDDAVASLVRALEGTQT